MSNKTSWIKNKAYDWQFYLPPARPSISELAIIEKYILDKISRKPKKAIKMAILGCTVEYRSLAHKYGLNVTLIDASKAHYKILSKQHMAYKGKEKLVAQDWRQMKISEKFDFILADNVLNMLNNQQRALALKNISGLLNKEGLFLPRTFVSLKNMPKNWKEILKIVRSKYPSVDFYVSTAAFVYPAYKNKLTEFTDVSRLLEDLRELKNKNSITKKEFDYWNGRMTFDKIGIAVPPLKNLNKQLNQSFKIKEVLEGNDVYSRYLKVHVLRARLK